MDNALLDPFLKLLADHSAASAVRAAEADGDVHELWAALVESGFLDALVSENDGGAGLAPAEIAPLVIACGEHLASAPVAETMVARAILTQCGWANRIEGPIALWPLSYDGSLRSTIAPPFVLGGFALTQSGNALSLVKLGRGERDGFNLTPAAIIADQAPLFACEASSVDLMAWSAAIVACQMAGAMNAVLAMAIEQVNTRVQFGRPLSKFQALQHNLAVMAEQVAAANVAATFGFANDTLFIGTWPAATAKCLVNEAAERACAIGHAVHGAIGISREHPLQLYVRRLKRWQLSFGSQSYWAREVAKPWLAAEGGTSLDIMRAQIGARAEEPPR